MAFWPITSCFSVEWDFAQNKIIYTQISISNTGSLRPLFIYYEGYFLISAQFSPQKYNDPICTKQIWNKLKNGEVTKNACSEIQLNRSG